MAKKGGLIQRLMLGSEKSETYARSTMPSNRWELFWDILKGRFGKLVLVNLLIFLFMIPLFGVIILRTLSITGYGSLSPFTQPFGVGYQASGSFAGFNETIILNVNLRTLLFLPVASIFAALGVSGGAYVIRNMVWTEGIFVANDFWRGIRQNFFSVLFVLLFYSAIFYLAALGISFNDLSLARGSGSRVLLIISKYTLIFSTIFFGMMSMHMVSLTVTYKCSIWQLIKSSFLLTLGLFPQCLLFAFIACLPFLFLLISSSFTLIVGMLLILLFSFSFAFLVWTDFCQWAYDKFVNDHVPGAQKNRGIYEKVKESDSLAIKQYREQLAMSHASSLSKRPIKPITDDELKLAELPQSFNRGDIERLNESRRIIYEDHEKYVEEHKNDPEFKRSEEEIAAEKARKEKEERIEKMKRELKKRDEQALKRRKKSGKK